jgi:predicted nucleotidyltransferase
MPIDYHEEMRKAAGITERLERALFVVAVWTEALKSKNIRPIVVGGTAVEFYSFGAYMTFDIDLVCANRQEALDQLEVLGFKRSESLRHWYHEELSLVVEIPDGALAGSLERVAEVEIRGFTAHIIGIEDLVLDRLRAFVHWRSEIDGEWVRRLLSLHSEDIDWEYLRKMASQEALDGHLEDLSCGGSDA